jgi:hypothetical protein
VSADPAHHSFARGVEQPQLAQLVCRSTPMCSTSSTTPEPSVLEQAVDELRQAVRDSSPWSWTSPRWPHWTVQMSPRRPNSCRRV